MKTRGMNIRRHASMWSRVMGFSLVMAVVLVVHAADPGWWTDPETQIISSGEENNHAPVLVGQLKNVALQAKKYLDEHLPGGAGAEVNAMIDSFGMDSEANHAPLLLGQLKYVAKPFYDRLQERGYLTKENLISHGYPTDWNYDTPWKDPQEEDAGNHSPALLGQLKMVFSFDLTDFEPTDTDGDGIPDVSEVENGLDPNVDDTGIDTDQDGVLNVQEYINGTNPLVKDNPLVGLKVNVIVQ